MTEPTELGGAYRVDLRLRPEGQRGPMVASTGGGVELLRHPRADLGAAGLHQGPAGGRRPGPGRRVPRPAWPPWVYGRYLSRADISGIKALKRRIEQQNRDGGGDDRNVKTGRGGIRDVEFVIQFLQLLNGGDLPALRTTNTLEAMAQLEHVGCLTDQERALLEENYTFLRRIEHLLQIMFDLQTHLLPEEDDELRKLALRMGYAESPGAAGAGGLRRPTTAARPT